MLLFSKMLGAVLLGCCIVLTIFNFSTGHIGLGIFTTFLAAVNAVTMCGGWYRLAGGR